MTEDNKPAATAGTRSGTSESTESSASREDTTLFDLKPRPPLAQRIAWDLPNPFTIDLEIEDHHADRYGHTNNAVYLSWCEAVAWAHTEAVGLDIQQYRLLNRAMAVRKTELQHLAPSFPGEQVRVGNWIVFTDGRLRAHRRYQIVRLDDGVTLLRALSMFVCIDLVSGRPRRMPEEFRRRYVVKPQVAEALARAAQPFGLQP
jgi:acyl-CoA thioester hydrolase